MVSGIESHAVETLKFSRQHGGQQTLSASLEKDEKASRDSVELDAPKSSYGYDPSSGDKVREALESVKAARKQLQPKIDQALADANIKLSKNEKLKLGVANGKISVGGIADKARRKEIEHALNSVNGLAQEIREFQQLEGTAKSQLKQGLRMYNTDAVFSALADGNSQALSSLSAIPLFADNPDLIEETRALLAPDVIDFSSANNWRADPKSTVEQIGSKAMADIATAVKQYNEEVEKTYQDDPEEVQRRSINLRDIAISMGGDGSVKIEGRLAASEQANIKGQAMIEEILRGVMEADKDEFGRSKWQEATALMVEMHEDEFGDTETYAHTGMVRLQNSHIDAFVSSPEADAAALADIQEEVNALLQHEGIVVEGGLEIAVDDAGRIRAVNPPADPTVAAEIETLLDSLSTMVTAEANQLTDASAGTGSQAAEPGLTGTAKRLAPTMRHLAAHRPGGDAWFAPRQPARAPVDMVA